MSYPVEIYDRLRRLSETKFEYQSNSLRLTYLGLREAAKKVPYRLHTLIREQGYTGWQWIGERTDDNGRRWIIFEAVQA